MHKHPASPPAPRSVYLRRLAGRFGVAVAIVLGSLFAGMVGFVYCENLRWLDAFLNAAMLLGGEGPLENPHTSGGKLFAGVYALYSGVVFLAVASVLLGPVAQRLIHRFHWEQYGDPPAAAPDASEPLASERKGKA